MAATVGGCAAETSVDSIVAMAVGDVAAGIGVDSIVAMDTGSEVADIIDGIGVDAIDREKMLGKNNNPNIAMIDPAIAAPAKMPNTHVLLESDGC